MRIKNYPAFFETTILKTKKIGYWEQYTVGRMEAENIMAEWYKYLDDHATDVTATPKGQIVVWGIKGGRDESD